MKKSRFTDSQIIAVLKQAEAGACTRPLSAAWHQLSEVLQGAQQVRRHGASMVSQGKELQDELRGPPGAA